MARFVAGRLLAVIPLLLLVSVLTFGLVQLSSADPALARLGSSATPEAIAEIHRELGIDRPAVAQYWSWLTHAVRGDLGVSWVNGRDVMESLKQRLPPTLSLLSGGILIAVLVGVTAGLLAAVRAGRVSDRFISLGATAGQAVPNFWLAILLVTAFAVDRAWFPATGYVGPTTNVGQWLKGITLPAISMGLAAAAAFTRQSRSAAIGVLGQPHVRTAFAKGLTRGEVIRRHVLRNAGVPIITLVGFQASSLLGGSIIVERVFAIPGIGSLATESVVQKDMPTVLAIVMLTALTVSVVSVATDLMYAWLNPRVRLR